MARMLNGLPYNRKNAPGSYGPEHFKGHPWSVPRTPVHRSIVPTRTEWGLQEMSMAGSNSNSAKQLFGHMMSNNSF